MRQASFRPPPVLDPPQNVSVLRILSLLTATYPSNDCSAVR